VDVSHVVTDGKSVNRFLVLLVSRTKDTFSLNLFTVKLRLDYGDQRRTIFERSLHRFSNSLVDHRTHFSTKGTDASARTAIQYAKANILKSWSIIDYSSCVVGVNCRGEGEKSFCVETTLWTQHLFIYHALCDLVVETEEEFHIAGAVKTPSNC